MGQPNPEHPQPQGVGYHKNTAQAHGCGAQHRTELKAKDWIKNTCRNGNSQAVIEEGPEQILPDIADGGLTQGNRSADPSQGTASADYIADNKLATKVAVIYNSSDVYSSGIYQNFAKEAEAKGLEVVAAEAFTADSKTDFSVQLQKAKSSGAELVFLPIYYQEASLILTQADKMGFTPKFFGCDGLDGLLDVEGFDTSLAEGVMLLTPFTADAEDEMTQTFVKAYEEAFDIAPIQFAADAYDCIYAIKAAAEQGEVTPDMSISDMCEAMKTAMTEITIDGLTGAGITWSADGEPSKEAKAVVISNGTYEAM